MTAWKRKRRSLGSTRLFISVNRRYKQKGYNVKDGGCRCDSPVSRTAAGKASWPRASWRPGVPAATRTVQLGKRWKEKEKSLSLSIKKSLSLLPCRTQVRKNTRASPRADSGW